jgi:hypothetical protein
LEPTAVGVPPGPPKRHLRWYRSEQAMTHRPDF